MSLQPLVENAIRHGIGRSSSAGLIEIRASRRGNMLEVSIRDDGPGFGVSSAAGRGIGLSNTRARLQQLYGAEARLILEDAPAGGALVTMSIPFHAAGEAVEPQFELSSYDNPAG
jgi:sensor histidine kinase YesM